MLDFSAVGNLIVLGSGDKTAHIWNISTRMSQVLTINDPLNNNAGVTSVVFSPNGRFVAAWSLDAVVQIWNMQMGQLIEHLMKHWDSVYSVSFTPDGKGLVSGSLDKTLKYWDVSGLESSSGIRSKEEGVVLSEKNGSQCAMNFTGHKVS